MNGVEAIRSMLAAAPSMRILVLTGLRQPTHAGIVLASQRSWTLSQLIHALDRLLTETTAEDWIGQVRWLNEWRD